MLRHRPRGQRAGVAELEGLGKCREGERKPPGFREEAGRLFVASAELPLYEAYSFITHGEDMMRNDPARTTPRGLARYACEFHEAAETLFDTTLDSGKTMATTPVLYLIGHSLELIFKSYLLHSGVQLEELRSWEVGHNLDVCYDKSRAMGLCDAINFTCDELSAFCLLNALYSDKQLEYIVTGIKMFPVYGYIASMNEKMISYVCPLVGYRY